MKITRLLQITAGKQPDVARLLYGKRRNAPHSFSSTKPSLSHVLLLHSRPEHRNARTSFMKVVKEAAAMGEIDRPRLLQLLRQQRAMQLLPRSLELWEWCTGERATSESRALWTAAHDSTLLAHINDVGGTSSKKVRSKKAAQRGRSLASEVYHRCLLSHREMSATQQRSLLGGLLLSVQRSGDWEGCLDLYHQHVVRDGKPTDAHHLHIVMSACRRGGAWKQSMKVFYDAVTGDTEPEVREGTTGGREQQGRLPPRVPHPSTVVYLELLRVVAQSPMQGKHRLAVKILSSLESIGQYPANRSTSPPAAAAALDAGGDGVELTAGHYNAVLQAFRPANTITSNSSTAGAAAAARRGKLAQQCYARMERRGVQPNAETLESLAAAHPTSLPHILWCVEQCHRFSLSVPTNVYRLALRSLIVEGEDGAAGASGSLQPLQFVLSECKRYTVVMDPAVAEEEEESGDMEDAPQQQLTTPSTAAPDATGLHLFVAVVDMLLAHPRPVESYLLLQRLATYLRPLVSALSVGTSTELGIGTEQSMAGATSVVPSVWLVSGRIAVVDHNVLLSPLFETLAAHYDAVLVPFSSVRVLTRRSQTFSPQGGAVHFLRSALNRLRMLLQQQGQGQGQAPADGSQSSSPPPLVVRVIPLAHQVYALRYLREGDGAGGQPSPPTPSLSVSERLLQALARNDAMDATGPSSLVKRSGDGQEEETQLAATTATSSSSSSRSRHPHSFISAPERVVAVAGMLKLFNADASIHVLSVGRDGGSRAMASCVKEWNHQHSGGRGGGSQTLTHVVFPQELPEKAPAELQL